MTDFTDYAHFEALDIRVARVEKVEVSRSKKPTYRLTLDFGAELGRRVSCAALRSYPPETLVGKQVVAVVNFPPRRMGPETSEVLILGVNNTRGEVVFLTPESPVPEGNPIY